MKRLLIVLVGVLAGLKCSLQSPAGKYSIATRLPERESQPQEREISHRPSRFLGSLSIKELAKRVFREVQKDDCLGRAAQLAYYLIFAALPFLLFLTALLGYIPVPRLPETLMEYLAMLLPGEALALIQDNIRQLVTERQGGLLSFGILAALWTASGAMVAISRLTGAAGSNSGQFLISAWVIST
jgi:hypothetical protein